MKNLFTIHENKNKNLSWEFNLFRRFMAGVVHLFRYICKTGGYTHESLQEMLFEGLKFNTYQRIILHFLVYGLKKNRTTLVCFDKSKQPRRPI